MWTDFSVLTAEHASNGEDAIPRVKASSIAKSITQLEEADSVWLEDKTGHSLETHDQLRAPWPQQVSFEIETHECCSETIPKDLLDTTFDDGAVICKSNLLSDPQSLELRPRYELR